MHARQIGQALATAIAALPPKQLEVVVLRDVEGLSAKAAADVVGIEAADITRLCKGSVILQKKRCAEALTKPACRLYSLERTEDRRCKKERMPIRTSPVRV